MNFDLYEKINQGINEREELDIDGGHIHPHPDNAGEHFHKGLTGISGKHFHDEENSIIGSEHLHVEGEILDGRHIGGGLGKHDHESEPYDRSRPYKET